MKYASTSPHIVTYFRIARTHNVLRLWCSRKWPCGHGSGHVTNVWNIFASTSSRLL